MERNIAQNFEISNIQFDLSILFSSANIDFLMAV